MNLITAVARRPLGILAGLFFLGIGVSSTPCQAGGGPENVFLLVNSESQDSMTVANHYIALRKIPPGNIHYMSYKGSRVVTSGKIFRDQILLPALAEIDRRGLSEQIDYFVYSTDFPWRIDFTASFPKEKFPPQVAPRGALTGLTYLYAFVKEERKEVVSPLTNWYCMESLHGITISRAFRSSYRWAQGGRRTGAQGLPYMISSMLGVTDQRGNSVEEIVRCLRTAKLADGTKPKGTVYYMKHGGPRSTPRHKFFPAAATELRNLGVAAKVIDGEFPTHKTGIAGLTCGIAYNNLGASGCRFLPGAFCDNLTSYGGLFTFPKSLINKKTGKKIVIQTTIADFIRHGATAANGTVYEPYNIRQKFPLPSVHVHYANGCSLGESFYQSVSGPYQQLLVGDPLCQPWASTPVVLAPELAGGALLRGEVEITPAVEKTEFLIREFELFVDGMRKQRCKPGKKFLLDTTALQDGYHELRVVARDETPMETQGRLIVGVTVKNGREAIGLTAKQKKFGAKAEYVSIDVRSTTETPVELFYNSLKLGSLPKGSGTLRIATDKLGAGPVEVYAQSEKLRSRPLRLDLEHR